MVAPLHIYSLEMRGEIEVDILKTKISRIKTTKPMSPPPVPYFQELPCPLADTVSSAMAKETRRRLKRIDWNILDVVTTVLVSVSEVQKVFLLEIC